MKSLKSLVLTSAPTTLILTAVSACSLLVALLSGSAPISFQNLINLVTLTDPLTQEQTLILSLRIPRILNAFTVGALLALSGIFMQQLLRNPLADPYILGTSGGASLGLLIASLAGFSLAGISLSAFVGSFISTLLVLWLARTAFFKSDYKYLLLVGVMVAAAWNALITCLLTLIPNNQFKSLSFWLMGEVNHQPHFALNTGVLLLTLLICHRLAESMNVLRLGPIKAQSLGINTSRMHLTLFIMASGLTGYAVSLAGNIGFIGLIVPHGVRLLVGSDHRKVIPLSAVGGGAFLVVADTLARTLATPLYIPVGAITALIGVPIFIVLMRHQWHRHLVK